MSYFHFVKPKHSTFSHHLSFIVYLGIALLIITTVVQPLKAQLMYLSKNDSAKVLQFQKSYQEFLSSGNSKEAARMINEAGIIYKNYNQYQKAIQCFEKSLKTNGNIENSGSVGQVHGYLGSLYFSTKKYDKSVEHFSQALTVIRTQNDLVSIINLLINRSNAYNTLKKFNQSITDLQEALALAQKLNDTKQVLNVYALLAETSHKMGDTEGATKYANLSKTYTEIQQARDANKATETTVPAQTNAASPAQVSETPADQNAKSELLKNLTRTEIEVALKYQQLAAEKATAEAAQERTAALERERLYTKIIAGIIILSIAIIAFVVYKNFKKEKEHNAALNKINLEIERQREQLSDSNDVKNKIFSIIAHDLRGPIGSLQSFFAIIDYFENVPDELRVLLDQFKDKNAQISAVLENLLNWAKTQMSELTPSLQSVAILPLVDENFNLYESVAAKKGISLVHKITSDVKVITDAEMTRIVIRNLIQNAIKFTHENGSVVVTCSQVRDGITGITIKDTGVGMSADKLKTLFNLKSNESTYGTKNEKGTGLGLVLCNDFIKTCGGSLEVRSQPNVGTEITILLKTA